MKKLIQNLILSGALLLGVANAQDNKATIVTGMNAVSNNIIRGYNAANLSLQPSLTGIVEDGNNSLVLSTFGNYSIDDGKFSELDVLAEASTEIKGVPVSVHYLGAIFPTDPELQYSQEVGVTVLPTDNISATIINDFGQLEGQYANITVNKDFGNVSLTGILGYDHKFLTEQSGFSHLDVSVSYKPKEGIELKLGLSKSLVDAVGFETIPYVSISFER